MSIVHGRYTKGVCFDGREHEGVRFFFIYGGINARKAAAGNHLWGFLRVRSHWFSSHMTNLPSMLTMGGAK